MGLRYTRSLDILFFFAKSSCTEKNFRSSTEHNGVRVFITLSVSYGGCEIKIYSLWQPTLEERVILSFLVVQYRDG